MKVSDLEDSVALNALINEMRMPKLKFQLIENQVRTYAEAMRQCMSYVTASEICHAHDTKKRKHDKREQGPSHPHRVHKEEPRARRDKGYPPSRHQGPPSEMGPLDPDKSMS